MTVPDPLGSTDPLGGARSAPPLARAAIDRDATARTDDARPARFDADPAARVLLVHDGRMLFDEVVEGSAPALALRHPSEPAITDGDALRIYLGRLDGTPVEARIVRESAATAIEPEAGRWVPLRDAVAVLDDVPASLATEAIAIANWHAGHAFCPRCGGPTEAVQSGWARRCLLDDGLLFPRTDPAVIVLVTDDEDRVLLGSNALWEQRRFSLLAGFVEPGEPLEQAVAREIVEEAGVRVDRVEYVASQPWPLPASLMLGFRARVAAGVDPASARPDGEEILELRWFSRDELRAARAEVGLPGGISIARWLLEGWFGEPIAEGLPWA